MGKGRKTGQDIKMLSFSLGVTRMDRIKLRTSDKHGTLDVSEIKAENSH